MDSEIMSVYEHCAFPAPECWGEFVNPEDTGLQMMGGAWWIQVKTKEGKTGWTREANHFAGWGM